MRPIKLVGATLLVAGLLAGCMGPATGATPEPTGPQATGPAPAGPTAEPGGASPTNPIAGPSDGAGKPSSSYEVPPPVN
jgi:hypothetical protein